MALADELLDNISEEQFAEYMLVEENPHIVIDKDRNIILPERYKVIAAQGDHNMATYTFDCPRFSDGRDMSKMVVYINYIRSDGETGSYPADNVSIDAQDNNLMHFEWTPLLPATLEHGAFAFLVCVCRTEPDGNMKNHWSTRLCKDATISEGMDCHQNTIIDMYPDVITRILERLNVLEDGGTTSVQYTVQDLEEEQKVQARKNIEAADAKEVSKLSEEIADLKENGTGTGSDITWSDIEDGEIFSVIDNITPDEPITPEEPEQITPYIDIDLTSEATDKQGNATVNLTLAGDSTITEDGVYLGSSVLGWAKSGVLEIESDLYEKENYSIEFYGDLAVKESGVPIYTSVAFAFCESINSIGNYCSVNETMVNVKSSRSAADYSKKIETGITTEYSRHHIVWVVKGDTSYLYYDGVPVTEGYNPVTTGFKLYVCVNSLYALAKYVRGYDKALTANEVTTLYEKVVA